MKASRKVLISGVFLILILGLMGSVRGTSPKPSPNIALDDLPSMASYVVKNDGLGMNWMTDSEGHITFWGTDPTQVIDFAMGNLTSGRTWKQTIIIQGDFTVSSTILVPSYTKIILNGRIRLANAADVSIMSNANLVTTGATSIELEGGDYDGNNANQVGTSVSALYFANCSDLKIHGITAHNSERYGLRVGSTQLGATNDPNSFVTLTDDTFYDNTWDNVVLSCAGSVTACSFYPSVTSNFLSFVVGKGITASGNFFYNQKNGQGYGVGFEYGSSNCTVTGNTFINCTFGVNLSTKAEEGNVISANNFLSYPTEGVCAINLNGTDNIISSNTISGYQNATVDGWGIYLNHGATDNSIYGNTITLCKYAFVSEAEVSGNKIYENYLDGNTNVAYWGDTNTLVRWNFGYKTEGSAAAVNVTATTWTFTPSNVTNILRVYASFNSTEVNGWKWTYSGSTLTVTCYNRATADQTRTCYIEWYSWDYQ